MSHLYQPQILLLKEGTDNSQGKAQIMSNITACRAIVDCIKSTLGPRGMDKLVSVNKNVTISNDGATIIGLLDISHPAAKVLADIARSQDEEVGDGTTSVVLIAGELLKEAKQFIEDGMQSRVIIRGFNVAVQKALEKLQDLSITPDQQSDFLKKCAQTALTSKLIAHEKEFFADMAVEAVLSLGADLDKKLIGVKQISGGSTLDSFLVKGVAFKKTFSYAGFEQQPKKFTNPKILALNIELELKAEKENAEVRIEDPKQYQQIIDAEWNIIYDKLNKIYNSGAQIILSKLPIGDLAAQFFADRHVFGAGRVQAEDLNRVCAATGAIIQTSVNDLNEKILGTCGTFEEKQVGNERYNLFTECAGTKTATIVLRGGAGQFIEEASRSLNDAIEVVRRAVKHSNFVAGGGAIDMELSRYLRDYSRQISGKQQLIINSFARALEIIPKTLAENAGFDSTDMLNKLRQKHAMGEKWMGVDITTGQPADMYQNFVWEPIVIKRNALTAATEAANLILSVDETVKNPKAEQPQH